MSKETSPTSSASAAPTAEQAAQQAPTEWYADWGKPWSVLDALRYARARLAQRGESDARIDAVLAAPSAEQMQAAPAMTEAIRPVGWLDDKGEFHRSPRHHFLGLVDEFCGSADHIWSGTSLDEACKAWKQFVAGGSKDVRLTGWGCGTIASHREMERQFGEAEGTFACPICGQDTPHQHTGEQIHRSRELDRWLNAQHEEEWEEIKARVARLEAKYPPRTPLYAAPAVQAAPAKVAGLYISGPYPDGNYSICELASGRVLQLLGADDFPEPLRAAAIELASSAAPAAGAVARGATIPTESVATIEVHEGGAIEYGLTADAKRLPVGIYALHARPRGMGSAAPTTPPKPVLLEYHEIEAIVAAVRAKYPNDQQAMHYAADRAQRAVLKRNAAPTTPEGQTNGR